MIEEVFRAEWSRVVATLVGFCGDLHVAEDAAQEAFAAAARRWPVDGPPDAPRAWLVTVARNRAVDILRRERRHAEKLRELHPPDRPVEEVADVAEPAVVDDERLELIFLCCHPALAPEAQVALTLRAVGGLDTPEIALALLVTEETMKRRLTRARSKVRDAGIPFRVPDETLLPQRLDTVLTVLYLIFNQGWGDGRTDLAIEAIRLATLLDELLPDQPQVTALRALMLLHDSRRAARFRDGAIVPLAEQDRTLWDTGRIAAGRELLGRALARGARGPYALQAAIAELQTCDPIDWVEVRRLYDTLLATTGSAVVALNRAVAVAETDSPAAALAIVDGLDLGDYRYLHSTRAELLRRLGDRDAARAAYDEAIRLAAGDAERLFLTRRRADL
ncbi:MAG: sigma-70 family RNA polymerase sigma factor [Pseudonocardia sp.]|uniref:RNA polymerase sigma factor n=1 Tax=unclassified Pseudonocardia TaxID=2619320 RepID=UPI00086D2E4F|nr:MULTISPECIES: sigma-70 family RNA polymerase sigma factor [unclassified Pseudonocardia]MBN9111644.1 sigma-70 family RNA polymerase sigma factor [Pseudonocardia sp.]ODU26450.1 MAG: RNA polymerase subunit sigma-24 [Pseudonocardia sp. SCN 72-51]ODU98144.1 MAG: RNA polymerase subunit sigma-24 [Pseudonocardia sp. SCN 73-27]